MISQIEDAIVTRIKTKLAAAAGMVSVQKGIEGIPQPAVYIATENGRFERVAQMFRQTVTIYVDIIFEHLGDESDRRKGIYLILEAITQTLLLQQLGLAIHPLHPKGWRNTTVEELHSKGLIAFSLELETSFTLALQSDEVVTDLLSLGISYFLQDPTPSATANASNTVSLPELPKTN